ncbi:hypothetical protein HGO38_01320 [Rhizobium sp. CG5]|uniref:hypothetical protein n=1 Tax=Rhizobium sp. CG5 TaxID=2726076 RepID=UPI00203469BB|nr:hypothetical protein [Rhizobium sp. CG5]MCM2472115.1 hypothetical protein [Rhizobium sp. CG5]
MTPNPPGYDEYKTEERRQAKILTDAINETIMATARTFEAPIMNALASALVANEAAMLASIEDPRHRKAMRKVMDDTRPRALAEAMTKNHGKAQVITLGGIRQ